jgi:hypothetical protein
MYIRDPSRNKFDVYRFDPSQYSDPDYHALAFADINYDALLQPKPDFR